MKPKELLLFFALTTLALQTRCQVNTSFSNDSSTVNTDTVLIKLDAKLFLVYTTDEQFKLIGQIKDSLMTVRLKLTYNNSMGTILEINNPFNKVLTYKAFLYNYKKKKYIETNVYPVREAMGSYEMWPYKLDQILLTDFKLSLRK